MSRQNRKGLKITTKGNLLGIKVNTTGAIMRDIFKKSGMTDRSAFLARVMPVAKQAMRDRVPALQKNLVQGVTLGRFGYEARAVDMPIGTKVEGLAKMEMTAGLHQGANHRHKVHKSFTNILTRIAEYGLSIRVSGDSDLINVASSFSNRRDKRINFHQYMDDSIPRASTVARRLDETCLPFIQSGRLNDLIEAWAANSTLSILTAIHKEFGFY
jgi:hypothetical protein